MFRFVDLFAGIGGFRIGLERVGGRCVFSCEWDKYSQRTYAAWHGEVPAGDIPSIRTISQTMTSCRRLAVSAVPDRRRLQEAKPRARRRFSVPRFQSSGVLSHQSLG